MAKTMKKLDSKLKKQQQGWPKSQTQRENTTMDSKTSRFRIHDTTKMKIWKITTAKFKCTREHIPGHDWLTKITRD